MTKAAIQLHRYPQDTAISVFLPIFQRHLPHSNPIYNRIQAPHNLPSRHCLFAATFEPDSLPGDEGLYTVIFADRSRHSESQIWVFNPLITRPSLTPAEQALLTDHLQSVIFFLKNTEIPEAPGWPFSPVLRFACLHDHIATSLISIGKTKDAVPYITTWNLWNISTSAVSSRAKQRKSLPDGFSVSRVPRDQVGFVISTSSIPRQAATLLLQPSVGLMNENGSLVAWGYVGIDGSLATLHVLPEYRGKGLATYVAMELLGRLGRGEFRDLGFDGRSGWAHSDVHEGNQGSEGVMRALGGEIGWKCHYVWIESEKFSDS
jgi:ribosomal protein S18 acetylase RimI-like enzyme